MGNDNGKQNRTVLASLGAFALATVGVVSYMYYNADEETKKDPIGKLLEYMTTSNSKDKCETDDPKKEIISEDDVVAMLRKICDIQQQTKVFLKNLVEEITLQPMKLSEVYLKVKEGTPEDPLASEGISMDDFDGLLNKFEHREDVKALIDTIMGNEILEDIPAAAKTLTIDQIVEIHVYMYGELLKVIQEAKEFVKTGGPYESRYITMAGQALVGAQVFQKYNMHPQEVEAVMMLNYVTLQYHHEFLKVSMQIQAVLGELMSVNGE